MTTTQTTAKPAKGFSDDEKAAAKARVKELKAEADAKTSAENCLAAIAGMPEPDRTMAKRVHATVMAADATLAPTTWYGMPTYAKDGKNICFFKPASKFKARYSNLGFTDQAQLDEGTMWASEFAITALNDAAEAKVTALVKKAVG